MVPKGFNQDGFLAWEDLPEHGSQDGRVNQASYEGQVNQSMVPRRSHLVHGSYMRVSKWIFPKGCNQGDVPRRINQCMVPEDHQCMVL